MEDVLTIIIQSIVNNEEKVLVKDVSQGEEITLEVTVAKEDFGKVIGKNGNIARAIRDVMRGFGKKEGKKVTVQFVD